VDDVADVADAANVADAAHRVLQHVVGVREGLLLRNVVTHHLQQLLVQHHDQAKRSAEQRASGASV
jgi:hypothetical protein